MDTVRDLLATTEFWMGLSLIATAIPGPQTKLLPALLRAVAKVLAANSRRQS